MDNLVKYIKTIQKDICKYIGNKYYKCYYSDNNYVQLITDNKNIIKWIDEYFDGYFNNDQKCMKGDITVFVTNNNYEKVQLLVNSYFHNNGNESAVLFNNNQIKLVYIKDDDCKEYTTYCILDKVDKSITIIMPSQKRELYCIVMRIVRSILINLLSENGWIYFHAACVSFHNIGIGLIGDKYSGKTTTMINLIKRLKFNFCSNDKIALKVINHKIRAFGFPIALGLRIGAIFSTKFINKWIMDMKYSNYHIDITKSKMLKYSKYKNSCLNKITNKIYIKPKDICQYFKVGIASNTNIKYFILPKYNYALKRIKIIKLDKQKAFNAINKQLLKYINPEMPWIDCLFIKDNTIINKKFSKIVKYACSNIPFYEVHQNENTTHEITSFINTLINMERKKSNY
jgi:hypothetical protein